ncbi:TetR family transcriptional regulator [Rhizobium sp. Root73]|uniref:TetR/AcrR family transcriptional regulator n=1 Tax=unclassified Rhizobium TaxID=2613769 RepID=UPI000724B26D|nr:MULTISPECIES: TetR/AcrR family transcriptional regulator [unclassified Rhizobium]KQY13069.1 TetR family transcriptional regulator [Rhizobium sp. Root1334]KRC12530.1 TetR family transcriptional regulator [Rhizobium sp. Root73]
MRREQMLDVAMEIVRNQGADELTLGTLAAKAGVSRPIAYEHFSTRAGLLVALFKRLEENYVHWLRSALHETPNELAAVADIISEAYFSCLALFGPEALAISAALKGTEEMAAQQRLMINVYVQLMYDALRPCSDLEDEHFRPVCVALLGAAEALASETQAGAISQPIATSVLTSLIIKAVADRPCKAR